MSQDYSSFFEEIEALVPSLIKKYRIPGAAITLINGRDNIWTRSFGFADKGNSIPVCDSTLFQVASISKSLTAWGIMLLVEEGKIDLDEAVDKYLSRWKLPLTRFNNGEVTIRRIMSHTAGLSLNSYLGYNPKDQIPTLIESLSGQADGVKELRVINTPGTKFIYSGGGFTLLQLIIEEVTGESFSSYMEDRILKPLGMYDSTFEWQDNLNDKSSKAYSAFGRLIPSYIYTEKAAAGLISSIRDISKFVEANLNIADNYNGVENLVLSPQSISILHSRVQRNFNSGLGFFNIKLSKNIKIITHMGVNRGWCSRYLFMPEHKKGLAIITNSDAGQNLITDLASLWITREADSLSSYNYKALKLKKSANLEIWLKMKLFKLFSKI